MLNQRHRRTMNLTALYGETIGYMDDGRAAQVICLDFSIVFDTVAAAFSSGSWGNTEGTGEMDC